jgi:hypothetical protein
MEWRGRAVRERDELMLLIPFSPPTQPSPEPPPAPRSKRVLLLSQLALLAIYMASAAVTAYMFAIPIKGQQVGDGKGDKSKEGSGAGRFDLPTPPSSDG